MYSPIASICSTVLILPPLLAAMTPCRITQKRSAVTPTSRTRITPVTHHGRSPRADSVMRAEPVSALSAIGSAILPKSVIIPLRLATWPSSKSVTEATPKTKNATIRESVSSATKNATKTGTSTSRSTVSPFGRLTSLGEAGELLASELVNQIRHQVHSLRARYPHPHEITDGQRAMCDHLGSAVHLRCLVRGPAAVSPQRTVAVISDDLLDSDGDLFSGVLARQRGGLGSVLVGIAEDTDGVQPCGGQELFELIDVVPRLARESDNEIRPDARCRRQGPDLLDQRQEPLTVTESAHRAQH